MIFHLAIPCRNLAGSMNFYSKLGAIFGRKYKTSFIMDLFGAQVVCHKTKSRLEHPRMYPRHFGCIVSEVELIRIWNEWKDSQYIFEPYFIRYKDLPEEHHTFFLKDPSNNLIEFKWYKNRDMVFGV